MPLTPNGKLDRRALPDPDAQNVERFSPPRNPTEEAVAKIWAEVLNQKRVSIDANFFDLGGHSLSATKLVSRVGEILNVELSLKSFFTDGLTVEGLAKVIEQKQAEQAGNDVAVLLSELDSLSDEEVKAQLASEQWLTQHHEGE